MVKIEIVAVIVGIAVGLGGLAVAVSTLPKTKKVDVHMGIPIFFDGTEVWPYFIIVNGMKTFHMSLEDAKMTIEQRLLDIGVI